MKKNAVMISVFTVLTIITIVVGVIFNRTPSLGEDRFLNAGQIIFSVAYILILLAIVIFLKIRRHIQLLKGIFLYHLAGSIFYVLCIMLSVMSAEAAYDVVLKPFLWWVWPVQSIGIVVSRMSIFSVRECTGMGFLIFTFIIGLILSSLIKDIAWDRQKAYEKEGIETK
ncbi:MAG: hypothetical protein LBI03_08895 [Clostridiales bacterium]|jgi:hypothetical protein|nr:hypothetical protein [Clostridiales bacterium]